MVLLDTMICVCPFDTGAAMESARLVGSWLKSKGKAAANRQIVKADCQIAGTAIFTKAIALYTDDEQLRRIAGRDIEVKPLPPTEQPEFDL